MVQTPLGSSHIRHVTNDTHVNKNERGMIVDLVRCVSMDLTSGSYDWDDGGTVERVRVEREEKADFGRPSCMVGDAVGGTRRDGC